MQNLCWGYRFLLLGWLGGLLLPGSDLVAQDRVWTDPTGKHETVASLLEYNETSVKLRKKNGVEIVVPLSRLCEADVTFVKGLLKKDRDAAAGDPALGTKNGTAKKDAMGEEKTGTDGDGSTVSSSSRSAPRPQGHQVVIPSLLAKNPPKIVEMSVEAQTELIQVRLVNPLKKHDHLTVRKTLAGLQKEWPSRPTAELLAGIKKCYSSRDKSIRLVAAGLLLRDDLRGNFELLVRCLDDRSFDVRWLAYDSIGALKEDRALDPLMKKFVEGTDLAKVASVLRLYGSRAEAKVLPFLKASETKTRMAVCSLLAKIGTARSLVPLQDRRDNDSELSVRYQAKYAIQKVESRLKTSLPSDVNE